MQARSPTSMARRSSRIASSKTIAASAEHALSLSLIDMTERLAEKEAALQQLAALHTRLLKTHDELVAGKDAHDADPDTTSGLSLIHI